MGEALVIETEGFVASRRILEHRAVAAELVRLDQAFDAVAEEIEHDRQTISAQLGDQYAAIFSAHHQMLRDPHLHAELEGLVRDQLVPPEVAVHQTLRRYARVFQDLRNTFLADRAQDLHDLEERLLHHLLDRDRPGLVDLDAPTVVLAHDLTPSETARLDRHWVRGFVTEAGGKADTRPFWPRGWNCRPWWAPDRSWRVSSAAT